MKTAPSFGKMVPTVAVVAVLGCVAVTSLVWRAGVVHAQSQPPKVERKEGHISPLLAKITYPDRTSRTVMVRGVTDTNPYVTDFYTHAMPGKDSASVVSMWLDTIQAIKKTSEDDATFVLKSGTERRLAFSDEHGGNKVRIFILANSDGGSEKLDLAKIDSIEFLPAARKDKDGNAMFDQWRYSPFTGEKLPEN